MKHKHQVGLQLAVAAMLAAACTTAVETKPVCGTLDAPLAADTVPAHVQWALDNATRYHEYDIFCDDDAALCVCAIGEADQQPTEGFGIVVVRNQTSTTFKAMRNSRQPHAIYDGASGTLWLATSAMEGTGVEVERLYKICFEGDSAVVAATIDPYDVQRSALSHMSYAVAGESVVLCIDGQPTDTVAAPMSDMGAFADDAVWIGESITYDLSDIQPRVCITPALRYASTPVLFYDDMPTYTADVVVEGADFKGIGTMEGAHF